MYPVFVALVVLGLLACLALGTYLLYPRSTPIPPSEWQHSRAARAPSTRLISLSLYGSAKIYNHGALENALLAREHFPGWEVRVHFSGNVLPVTILQLASLPHVSLVWMGRGGDHRGKLWRYLPLTGADPGLDVVVVRDVDARLSSRDAAAVHAWLTESDASVHVVRDHHLHRNPMLAGLCGFRRPVLGEWWFHEAMARGIAEATDTYDTDERFLAAEIYPIIREEALVHIGAAKPHHGESSIALPPMGEETVRMGDTVSDTQRANAFASSWKCPRAVAERASAKISGGPRCLVGPAENSGRE